MAVSRPAAVAMLTLATIHSLTLASSASDAQGYCPSALAGTDECVSRLSSTTIEPMQEHGLHPADACPAGQYPQIMTGTCIPCAPGRAKAKPGAGPCVMCGLGSYASGEGNTKCHLCPAGTFSSSRIAISCTPCPGGKFSPKPGAHECIPCFENHFSEEGSSRCTRCPRGMGTEGRPGATSCVKYPEWD